MKTFSEISKQVGFTGFATWPTLGKALELKEQVENGSEVAFETVFRINRFAPSPISKDETESHIVICQAFIDGCKKIEA